MKYVLRQIMPGNHPCGWYLVNKDPAVLVDRILDPAHAVIVKLDVSDFITSDILMKMTDVEIDAGRGTRVGAAI